MESSIVDVAAKAYCFEVPSGPQSPVFHAGHGIELEDEDGRVFVDAISGIFVACFGYDCSPIIDGITRQLHRLAFSPPLHGISSLAVELAAEVAALAGDGFDCVKLVCGGSESIEAALRITRLYQTSKGRPHKTKILSNYDSYHGSTYGSLSLTGRADVHRFEPSLPGFLHVWPPECLACPFELRYPSCNLLCASMIERMIETEGPESVGAIFIEPVIHLLGMVVPPPEYFRQLREICDRHNVLLVFDEIVTGFGRTGEAFAAHTFSVKPDLICMGKGLSGGYAPLAAVVMSQEVSAVLRDEATGLASFAPSHTYAGNPVSAAAGLEALRLLKGDGMLEQVRSRGAYLNRRLQSAVGERGRVRGVGLLQGVKLNTEEARSASTDPQPGRQVQEECLRRGVIVRGEADWIVLAPPFIATERDLDHICEVLRAAVESLG